MGFSDDSQNVHASRDWPAGRRNGFSAPAPKDPLVDVDVLPVSNPAVPTWFRACLFEEVGDNRFL